ncbi:MAG TPA: hypothetical protein VIJ18_08320 [Microbacteriaceae bacterium]
MPDELDADIVDLSGGFLMPAFGDGHAHPRFGGLEDSGPHVRTPKPKTLDLFGTPGVDSDGKPVNVPFHVYSMRQAIEENFILDVLANYVTYSTYYRLNKEVVDTTDDLDKKKAAAALARFASLHPTNLAQRAEVIVEHFATHMASRMGGQAKAMVVTRSRLHALKLYQAVTAYCADHYPNMHALVAFSGSLVDDNVSYTEAGLNGFAESRPPAMFNYTLADGTPGSDRVEYSLLVVADKYQTGFDQPLLSAMYVDKKLANVAAVQTLSRLNRIHPLKSQDDVFVLDFANSAEEIQESFRPFFATTLAEPTDPNYLYTLQTMLFGYQIFVEDEMAAYAQAFSSVKSTATGIEPTAQAALYSLLGPARGRFESLHTADMASALEFVKILRSYERQYAFLAQVIPYVDADLERLYLFGKFLLRQIAALLAKAPPTTIDLGDVAMTHLRIQKGGDYDLSLGHGDHDVTLGSQFDDGSGSQQEPELTTWEAIIREFNEHFGTDWTSNDLVRGLVEAEMQDTSVHEMALTNSAENFELAYGDRASNRAIEKHSDNEEFFGQIFKNAETKAVFTKVFAKSLYTAIRDELDEAG